MKNIKLEKSENKVYQLTVNRPKQLNALSRATIAEIGDAIALIEADIEARALLITGAGDKAFVAGADISEFTGVSPIEARQFALATQKILRRLEQMTIPVIAVVNGYALGGGCELAMACDWIIASKNARFGQPEVNLGLIPGFGGTQRLMRIVGKAMAMDMCLTGRMIDAEEALRIGLVNQVFEADTLDAAARELAKTLGEKAPIALNFTKEAMRCGQDMSLDDGCTFEAELFGLCFSTKDQDEGVAAFLEKRKAAFKGT